jgi:sugar O-acyltransferase (sialic acid O-acetyltransferase NeuD family)
MSKSQIYILGGGGHARVLIDLYQRRGVQLDGLFDPNLSPGSNVLGVPVLGPDSMLNDLEHANATLINGIGVVPKSLVRAKIARIWRDKQWRFETAAHDAALISDSAQLSEGCQVLAGAIVQCCASLGADTVVNTGAIVDHDCVVGANVFIAPGVTLCGGVLIGDGAFIGAGATIIPGVRIGNGAIVGAGVVVRADVPADIVHV